MAEQRAAGLDRRLADDQADLGRVGVPASGGQQDDGRHPHPRDAACRDWSGNFSEKRHEVAPSRQAPGPAATTLAHGPADDLWDGRRSSVGRRSVSVVVPDHACSAHNYDVPPSSASRLHRATFPPRAKRLKDNGLNVGGREGVRRCRPEAAVRAARKTAAVLAWRSSTSPTAPDG